ncbi:MAG: glycosyl hydrolase family 10 [Cellvibrionales bacterium]|nr:glycosyl hydrolase family 10 [Cellvibrionales bacterium]
MAFLSACVSTTQVDVASLRDTADFPIGSSIRLNDLKRDHNAAALQQYHFDSFTTGLDMKMNKVMPTREGYNWKVIDEVVAYTQRHDQRLFGHNLIWHASTPQWVVQKAQQDPQWLDGFMKAYIHNYVGRYKGIVHGWDVVNEGLVTKGAGYRTDSIWYQTMGKRYIEKAFQYAHEADPDAILFYNDFNTERDMQKFDTMMTMVEDFLKRGIPISGIGFQMHIRMDIPNTVIASTLERAAATGLQIHLSEVDIIFNTHDDSRGGGIENYKTLTNDMKLAQQKKYQELVQMYRDIVPKEQQYGITFWGFNDRDSWIRRFFKMNDWPTIYDDDLKPKPAFFGFLEGLK